ncbi:T-cell receptor beta chain ANA 11, putative [Brugia malayi]|uniref:T-cell receptor beta chain ANA 11, putative n=2 Tax=Brugia malayi TaxID=6279 RepID=A0A4E9FEG2_BRUMA|nr:T-cell receptor beta chain ANA 11, putative [Brugia malayi]VIO93159.1 T-cell receptor beta chain ANA 11, putative [Brugia malayi]
MNEAMIGFLSCIISCIAFGFMFVPLRKFDSKDGLYVQWIQCAVVFVLGFVINIVRGFPAFNPIAMVGGFLFATGNIASVPIINHLGIGVAMLVWGSIQVLVGWGVARFGFFGTQPQLVYNNVMNIVGLLFVLFSGFMFIFVKHKNQDEYPVTKNDTISMQQIGDNSAAQNNNAYKLKFHITKKKIGCLGLSVLLGILHGLMMTPIAYIQDNDSNASPDVLDYVFPHFCAIFFSSTVYFIAYCVWMRDRIHAPAELILPSATYGILWCTGMILWFISNHLLSQTVSFPITTRLPSTIGVLLDVVFFKDIKGKKNLTIAFSAVTIGLIGVLLIAFSNQRIINFGK